MGAGSSKPEAAGGSNHVFSRYAPPICHLSTSVREPKQRPGQAAQLRHLRALPSREGIVIQLSQLNSTLTRILIQQLTRPVLLQPSGCPPVHFRGKLTLPRENKSFNRNSHLVSNRRTPPAPSPSSWKSRSAWPKNSSASASASSKPSPRSRRSSPK